MARRRRRGRVGGNRPTKNLLVEGLRENFMREEEASKVQILRTVNDKRIAQQNDERVNRRNLKGAA